MSSLPTDYEDSRIAGAARPPWERDAGDEDADCCSICFETGNYVKTNCACRQRYCAACWDRSLATSILLCGKPLCPSCRAAFVVDLVQGRPVCYPDPADGEDVLGWRRRLYSKTRPLQMYKLRDFGAQRKATECGPQATECGPQDATSAATSDPNQSACLLGLAAPCMCGSELECVTPRRRVALMIEERDAGWRPDTQDAERLVDRLVRGLVVTCDLCGKDALRSGAAWTCRGGQHVLLHPGAYDICEGCFTELTGLAPKPKRSGSKSLRQNVAAVAAKPLRWLQHSLKTAL